jgi:hypothetical protein
MYLVLEKVKHLGIQFGLIALITMAYFLLIRIFI